jgi:hypothetical protein
MAQTDDDFVPVTGGVDLPASQVRDDTGQWAGMVADTDLDKQLLRLFALHPDLRARFDPDVTELDIDAKRALLDEIYDALGVRRLGRARK